MMPFEGYLLNNFQGFQVIKVEADSLSIVSSDHNNLILALYYLEICPEPYNSLSFNFFDQHWPLIPDIKVWLKCLCFFPRHIILELL